MKNEKIQKNANYLACLKDSEDELDYNGAIEIDSSNTEQSKPILRNTSYTEELIRSKYDLESIDDYKTKVQEKKRKARLEEERKKKEAQKIDTPVDLSGVNTNFYEALPEKRVNFKRTFGVSNTRKKKIEKITTIIIFIIFGILITITAILSS